MNSISPTLIIDVVLMAHSHSLQCTARSRMMSGNCNMNYAFDDRAKRDAAKVNLHLARGEAPTSPGRSFSKVSRKELQRASHPTFTLECSKFPSQIRSFPCRTLGRAAACPPSTSTARSMIDSMRVGQFSGAGGCLPIRPRCRRV